MKDKKCYIPVVCEGCCGFPGDDFVEIPLAYTTECNGFVFVHAMTDKTIRGNFFIESSNGMAARSFCASTETNMYGFLPVASGAKVLSPWRMRL